MADPFAGGFLGRWARRKAMARLADARVPTPDPADETGMPADEAEIAPAETRGADEPAPRAPLPDVESLTRDSDFAAFMAPDVPSELRNRALRKLWRMDPVFANLDGLNDYDQDYTDAATVPSVIRTAYKIGRGFAEDVAAGPEAEAPTEVAMPVAPSTTGAEAVGDEVTEESKAGQVQENEA